MVGVGPYVWVMQSIRMTVFIGQTIDFLGKGIELPVRRLFEKIFFAEL